MGYHHTHTSKACYKLCRPLVTGILFLLFSLHLWSQGSSCTDGTPSFDIDLSDSPDATWDSPGVVDPTGQCCDVPDNHNCMEFVLTLHPDVSSVSVAFTTPTGGVYYQVNCGEQVDADDNLINFCFDEGDTGPHYITFCRPGTPSYEFSVFPNPLEAQIDLEPFDPVCIDSPGFLLDGGTPEGGHYYINGSFSSYFDPAVLGVGDHEITYVIQDDASDCVFSTSEIITVVDLPEVTWDGMEFCDYEGLVDLEGAEPEGGFYSGNYVSNDQFNVDDVFPGSYEVFYTYVDEYGCSASESADIIIHEPPIADAGEDQTIIVGDDTQLNAADGGDGDYDYYWEPSDLLVNPNTQNPETEPLDVSTAFTLTVTDLETGCIATDQMSVIVIGDDLHISDIVSQPDAICFGEEAELWVLAGGGSGNYIYHWEANPHDPTLVTDVSSPVVSPEETTWYTVTITDEVYDNLDPVVDSVEVVVHPLPDVTLDIEPTVCANEPGFSLTGGEPEGGTYYLLDHHGNPLHLPYINFDDFLPDDVGEGIYEVVYEYTNPTTGCTSFATAPLEILPFVSAQFYLNRDDICISNEVNIANHSVGADTYDWDFGDGTDSDTGEEHFMHTFPLHDQTQDYTIHLEVSNDDGCSDTQQRSISVIPSLFASFTPEDLTGCSPVTVDFESLSEGPILYHFWDFGNNTFSVEENPTRTFDNFTDEDVVYTAKLTLISNNFFCAESDSIDITVHPYTEAGFTLNPVSGCSPLEVEFGNTSTGALSYHWDFGDTHTSGEEVPDNHIFSNTGQEVETYTITQTVANENCDDEISQTLEVYPEVKAQFNASETEVCAPFTIDFTNLSTKTATKFHWDFDDGGTSSEENPSHTFENNTGETQTYTVTLNSSTEHLCEDVTSMEIIVHPYIEAGFDFLPAQACNGHEVAIVNTATGASQFEWDFGDGYNSTADSDTVFHFFEHDEENPQEFEVELWVTNEECQDVLTRPITIFPKVISQFTATPEEGCSSLEISFENESTGASDHLWEFGDGGSSSQENAVHIFENNSFEEETVFDVWLYSQSEYLCKDSIMEQITIYPDVKADFTIEENAGCSPFIVTIENHTKGASTLQWDFGDGHTDDSNDELLVHTFENTTNEVITREITLDVVNEQGCTDQKTRTITIYPEVQIEYNHITEGCHPLEVEFDNDTENANYYSWDFGDEMTSTQQNPGHTFYNYSHLNTVEFDVELYASSIYGCFAQATSQVTVYPRPSAGFHIENSPGCSPHEIVIHHESLGAQSHEWDFGDNSGTYYYDESLITHEYTQQVGEGTGTYPIELWVENDMGCDDSLVQNAIIYPEVEAAFEANTLEGCHPLTVDFTNLSEGANAEIAYQWDYGNGNTSQNVQLEHAHTFQNFSHTQDTTYTVILTALNQNGCLDTTALEITVFPRPKAYFSVPNTPGCAPHDVNIHNFSVGAQTYHWQMGDGTSYDHGPDHFTHEYYQEPDEGAGQFNIVLEVDNSFGCEHTYEQQIVIYPAVEADFVTDNEGCHPHSTTFENLSQGGDSYLWDFDNGNTSQGENPSQTFLNYGHTESETYTVTLLVESTYGCSEQTTQDIVVMPAPKTQFELSSLSGCSPFSPEINNITTGAESYLWTLAEEETYESDSIEYTWHNQGETPVQFDLELTAWSEYGCESSDLQTVTVYPEVTADFSTEDDIWEGCSPLSVRFTNTSELADSYSWDFSDGNHSNSAAPLHVFQNLDMDDHTYPVQLVAESLYGCKDTLEQGVTVFPSPVADFAAQPKSQPYPNATVTLGNQTNPGHWEFDWEFGDGNNLNTDSFDPITHTYIWDENDMTTKHYVIALYAYSEKCSDLKTKEVTITSPVPEAEFSHTTSGCVPFTVQFNNQSLYAHTWHWDFGDGGVSDAPSPEYTFYDHGHFDVRLVAIGDGGRDTLTQQVKALENPTANFELVSAHVNIPEEPLQVINTSELADFYFWEFGDGQSSYDFEPEHYYSEPGIYDITLVATRNSEPLCHDTLTLENSLRVDKGCKIIFPNAFQPDVSGPSDGHYDMSNPSTKIFHPVHTGVDEYVLEIYNRWGELIFRTEDINRGWDGYHKGSLAKMDVYVWKVSGRCANGRSITLSGDVTLYR